MLGLSFAETDKIVKLYPAPKQGRDFPLEDALEMEPRLKDERKKHPELFDYAFKLEGLLRHASRHAAGVVISDQPLADIVPLYVDKEPHEDSLAITQYSMKGIEEIGLIKFDFLALKNLTLIKDTLDLIAAGGQTPPDLARLRSTTPTPTRCCRAATRSACSRWKARACAASSRSSSPPASTTSSPRSRCSAPARSTRGMATMAAYVHRKHGKEPVEYDHPLLEPVLSDTYGVIVYQEQVMRAAQALAGYSLEQADILRAAMGKKNKAVMEKERARFIEGAMKNGVNAALASTIFEKIETFASYGFNRSHAAAYALTTYTTAYLKAHFPLQFMAALMSLDMDDVAKTYKNIAALRDMKIRILPPDVNQSRVKFAVTDDAIRFGLAAIRGVGAKTAEAIVAVRESGGPFKSLTEFCLRVGAQLVSRRVLEALIKCGAFDSIGQARAALMAQAEVAIKLAQKAQSDAEKNQIGLFGGAVKVPKLPAREPIA